MADESLLKSTNGNVLYMQGGNTTIVKSEDNTVDVQATGSGSITTFDLSIADSLSTKVDEAPEDGKAYARKDGEWTLAQTKITSNQETINIAEGDESTNIESTKYYLDDSTLSEEYNIGDAISNETELTITDPSFKLSLDDYPTSYYIVIQYKNYDASGNVSTVLKTYENLESNVKYDIPTNAFGMGQTSTTIKITSASPAIVSSDTDKIILNSATTKIKKEVQEKMVAGDNIDIAEDGKTISVTGKKTLNVQAPITFDKDTATIGFDDSDYAKKEDIPTDFYTKEETDSAISNAVADKVTTTQLQTEVGNLTTSIGNVQSNVESVSSNLDTNYYTKTQVDGFLKNWSGFVVVGEGEDLPDPSEAELGKIYLKKSGTGKTDNYTEWICDGTAWSQIGEMSIDLSNYYTKKEIEDNYATLGDLTTTTTNLENEIDEKISTVAVDGSTITGDGTASNPLKATTDMSSAYTLVQGTYVKLVDDTENKKTKIDDSLIGNIVSTVNSLGNEVSGLESAVGGKQEKLDVIINGTTYTSNAVTLIETASNKIEGVAYNYKDDNGTLQYGKLYTVPDYSSATSGQVLSVNSNNHLEWTTAPSGVFIGTYSGSSTDTTYDEYKTAADADKEVMIRWTVLSGDVYARLEQIDANKAVFIRVGLGSADTVSQMTVDRLIVFADGSTTSFVSKTIALS